MSIKWFNRKVLTGGGVTALDAVLTLSGDADSMAEDGDRAFVYTADGLFYTYEFDSGATDAEAAPLIIRADDGGGVWRLKRWSDSAPVGVPYMWFTDTAPSQHMFVYGQGLSTSTYPELFAVFRYTYGGSSGTFYLPKPQGRFFRVVDDGEGVDPDAADRTDRGDGTTGDNVGTIQEDEFKSHNHVITSVNPGRKTDSGDYTVLSPESVGKTTQYTGGNETRSKNMAIKLIVKYE
jgi:microcystin-dependent protein